MALGDCEAGVSFAAAMARAWVCWSFCGVDDLCRAWLWVILSSGLIVIRPLPATMPKISISDHRRSSR